jgi:hypothetical protein
MFTKIAIALAIILGTASGTLAATKKNSINPSFDTYNSRGMHSDPDPHVRLDMQRDRGWHGGWPE